MNKKYDKPMVNVGTPGHIDHGCASGSNGLLCELHHRYELDFKWRCAWNTLAHITELGKKVRLQSKQEYIERRAQIANERIAKLMRDFDNLNT